VKPPGTIFIVVIILATSCSKVYDPHVDTTQNMLVVDGIISNKTDAYHVGLTYAKPFNSSDKGTPVSSVNVFVTDDLGNSYKFNERGNGNYVSDSLQFTGKPGHTYRLHIITSDGIEYESDPQKIYPEVSPDSVYAEFDTKETLSSYSGLIVNTYGADILTDISNHSDSLPRFRFTSNLVLQYYYNYFIFLFDFEFYCWQTVNANSNINLTDEEYSVNSASFRKHQVCFVPDYFNISALEYDCITHMEDTTGTPVAAGYKTYDIHHRILYLNMYTLNNETYLYYKSLNQQLQSEGKLFDPVAAQLTGNIKCITDPEKKVLGFFEASSVCNLEYVVDFRNLVNSQPALIKTPYILPPEPDGCQIKTPSSKHQHIPPFWISAGNTTKSNL
jgi:Domain of unknown function (DUF4249)